MRECDRLTGETSCSARSKPITAASQRSARDRRQSKQHVRSGTTASSDAFGTFAIRVPDGQWIVRVTMPSGNMQTVRNITVTDGKVMDNLEAREVQNLIISF